MMTKTRMMITALILMMVSVSANALIVVDFTTNYAGGGYFHNGQFTGTDANSDGILEFSELASFDILAGTYAGAATIANLNDIGDYLIAANSWIANGISWVGYSDEAWYTWDNRIYSARPADGWVVITSNNSVPEPATLALMGLGLAGIGFARKKKAA
ncbi:MAG: PEP-CTERM sorting domain-containing protein [Sedimenticola sp.]